jgi:hypothetical protein
MEWKTFKKEIKSELRNLLRLLHHLFITKRLTELENNNMRIVHSEATEPLLLTRGLTNSNQESTWELFFHLLVTLGYIYFFLMLTFEFTKREESQFKASYQGYSTSTTPRASIIMYLQTTT